MNILLKREWNYFKWVLEYETYYFGLDSARFVDIVMNFGIDTGNFRYKKVTKQYESHIGYFR